MNKKYSVWSNFKYLFSTFLNAEKRLKWLILVYLLTGTLVPLGAAVLPAIIISEIEKGISWQQLLFSCIVVFALYGLIYYLYQFTKMAYYSYTLGARMRTSDIAINKKVLTMDYQSFESNKVKMMLEKAIMALYYGDYNGNSGFLLYSVMLLESVLGLIVYTLLIGTLNIWIVMLLFVLSIFRFAFYNSAKKYEKKNKDKKSEIAFVQDYLARQSGEIQSGKDVRIYQLYHWLTNLYKKKNKEYTTLEAKEKSRFFLSDLVGLGLDFIRDGICYSYIFIMIESGMPVSSLIFYINMVRGFGTWMSNISENLAQVTRNSLIVSDFRSFIDYQKGDVEIKQKVDGLDQPWCIEFKDVSFSYEGSDRKILDHLNLIIKEKEKVAIVGLNGAGKTTMIKLLCGLYHPTNGQILINGIDIETIDRTQLFSYISAIFQDTFLMSFTIKENITMTLDESKIDQQRYEAALYQSGIYDKIMSLKDKDDTYLNKDISSEGISLSGGQIQKVLFARAMYKSSKLLVLDEPTAALDAIAESEMYELYNEIALNQTSIFISHRLASTRFCNRILYFEDGQVLEEGTHEELLKRNGKYAYLYDVQSQYYKKGGEEHEADLSIL